MFNYKSFFNIDNSELKSFFEKTENVWEAIPKIKDFVSDIIKPNTSKVCASIIKQNTVIYQNEIITDNISFKLGDVNKKKFEVYFKNQKLEGASFIFEGASILDDSIYIGKGTVIEPGALIKGPTFLGNYNDIRQGSYIRGNVYIGNKCVLGHTTEIKNSMMICESKAGHFAYLGDSILGSVNLGAGTKLANLKIVDSAVKIRYQDISIDTGLRKFGAILGDGVEMGCNSVTTPGTIIGKNSLIYPNITVKGYIPENSFVKPDYKTKIKKKRM